MRSEERHAGYQEGWLDAIAGLRSDECYYEVAKGKPGVYSAIEEAADWLEAEMQDAEECGTVPS